jgi:3-deoxy-7-phosphoheptulonate synthase
MLQTTDDLRIDSLKPIKSPILLIQEHPLSLRQMALIRQQRQEVEAILQGKDDRLLVVVGPCSIHDTEAALEYGQRLAKLSESLADELCIVMRVYFEKPRTTVGWKGLINDPYLDNSFHINQGLQIARKLLLDLADLGVVAGTEFLDTIIPQYLSDAIVWAAIGARTTESQIHRELASGLSMPVGFKNGTDGNMQVAIDAIASARHPHHFLSISKLGIPVIVATKGNDCTHIILRGANHGPNYDAKNIATTTALLAKNNIATRIMIDCSHGNSSKDHRRQAIVLAEVIKQINDGSSAINGVMIESNLVEGKQNANAGQPLVYGQSITDACVSWEQTETMLQDLAQAIKQKRSATLRRAI